MIKRVYDLSFDKDNQFVIYKRLAIFGIFITKTEIARFSDINEAVKHLKSII